MFVRLMRVVAVVCGVFIALPSGWCCMVGAATVAASVRCPAPPKACCKCGCPTDPAPGKSDHKPAQNDPSRCCCADKATVKQDDGAYVHDVTFVGSPFFSLPVSDNGGGGSPCGRFAVPVPSPPLHVLKCVWLC